jgi:uncharacterized protein YndB with AHSA1/START domain
LIVSLDEKCLFIDDTADISLSVHAGFFGYYIKLREMKNGLFIKNSIAIDAPMGRVWNALVNPEETKKYMFGCEALSDWKAGSPLIWKGSYEGQEMIFVKGNIIDIQPEKILAYTVIDPNAPIPDIPENYLTVTYTLRFENGQTILSVTQGDYAKVADGERRYNDSYNNGEGWNPILKEIKKLAEEN